MTVMRVCSGYTGHPCGKLARGRRCSECQRQYEQARGSRRVLGHYDSTWRKLVAQAIREHPWCEVCKTGGTSDNPLTGDHRTPWSKGGRNVRSNVEVLCRGCNSRKGARSLTGAAVE